MRRGRGRTASAARPSARRSGLPARRAWGTPQPERRPRRPAPSPGVGGRAVSWLVVLGLAGLDVDALRIVSGRGLVEVDDHDRPALQVLEARGAPRVGD